MKDARKSMKYRIHKISIGEVSDTLDHHVLLYNVTNFNYNYKVTMTAWVGSRHRCSRLGEKIT